MFRLEPWTFDFGSNNYIHFARAASLERALSYRSIEAMLTQIKAMLDHELGARKRLTTKNVSCSKHDRKNCRQEPGPFESLKKIFRERKRS